MGRDEGMQHDDVAQVRYCASFGCAVLNSNGEFEKACFDAFSRDGDRSFQRLLLTNNRVRRRIDRLLHDALAGKCEIKCVWMLNQLAQREAQRAYLAFNAFFSRLVGKTTRYPPLSGTECPALALCAATCALRSFHCAYK